MDLIIRNVDPAVAEKLKEMAAKRHMSREHFLRQCLTSFSVQDELLQTEDRYSALLTTVTNTLAGQLQENTEILTQTTESLSEFRKLLENYKKGMTE